MSAGDVRAGKAPSLVRELFVSSSLVLKASRGYLKAESSTAVNPGQALQHEAVTAEEPPDAACPCSCSHRRCHHRQGLGHPATLLPCHPVTVPPCHCVTLLLCHPATVPPCCRANLLPCQPAATSGSSAAHCPSLAHLRSDRCGRGFGSRRMDRSHLSSTGRKQTLQRGQESETPARHVLRHHH